MYGKVVIWGGSEMPKKWIGKVSGRGLKRGMILDPSRRGFGLENGGPGGSKSEQKSDQKMVPKMDGSKRGQKAKFGQLPICGACGSGAWGGGRRRGKPLLGGLLARRTSKPSIAQRAGGIKSTCASTGLRFNHK